MLAQLDAWLDAPGGTGWVVVTGGPGMGKSAIVSAWLARREATGGAVPYHLIRRQVADWDQPEVIAASLAAQIEIAFPALRDSDAKPERRLLELLGRVSKQLGATGRLVVVVDGLDETRAEPGENPLPRFLPHVVPAGIRFLCATRPTHPHLNWIEARSPVRRLDLDDARCAASNEAVVRGFWDAVAAEYQPPLSAAMLATVIARAEGNVLHAVMLHDALRDLPAERRSADRIPRGLKELIGEVWDLATSREAVRVGLGLLCAAQEALSLHVLAELAGWSYDDKQRFVREARQLLLEEPASWAGVNAYRPRHDWVRELVAERLGAATLRAHHRTLSQKLATWPPPVDEPQRSYAVRHALGHRIFVYDWAGVRALASDLGYLEARTQLADVYGIEQELAEAEAKCPEPETAADLSDLAWALARESHRIRHDPKATPGLVWNRLRRTDWTAEKLDARITVPETSAFLRVRCVASGESGSLERTIQCHSDRVFALAVVPDGRRIIAGCADGTLCVADLHTGRVLGMLEGHTAGVTACAAAPDERRVVSASIDRTLKLWDLDTGRILTTLEGHADRVNACAVTPDGRRVVSASADRTLKIWDIDTRHTLVTLTGHTKWVTACAVTPDGRRVVSASIDRTLRVWDLDGSPLATLAGHDASVTACAVTPDGRRVVSASTDGTLKIWNLETGDVLATFQSHGHWLTTCAVTPNGRWLVSASTDCTLKIWDLDDGRDLATFAGHADSLVACAVTPDGQRVVSASIDGTLKVWDLRSLRTALRTEPTARPRRKALQTFFEESVELASHHDCVNACALTAAGRRAVTASHDRTLQVWDVDTGRVVFTLREHTDWVTACAVISGGKQVLSASADGRLVLWSLEIPHDLHILAGRPLLIEGQRPFGRSLANYPFASELVLESPARSRNDDIRVVSTLNELAASVRVCVPTPDGRRVVSVAHDGRLTVYSLTGEALATLGNHYDGVRACAITPDGQRLVSGASDGTLTVWNLDTGQALAALAGHTDAVNACVVTPDGRRVVSASSDGTLSVWDLATGLVLTTLSGHTDKVTACAVAPDGRHVLSASDDGTLKLWDLTSAACLVTHHGDAGFRCVAATADVIVAGDRAGTVWFLEWPRRLRETASSPESGGRRSRRRREQ